MFLTLPGDWLVDQGGCFMFLTQPSDWLVDQGGCFMFASKHIYKFISLTPFGSEGIHSH